MPYRIKVSLCATTIMLHTFGHTQLARFQPTPRAPSFAAEKFKPQLNYTWYKDDHLLI